ncbi:MAG: uroporphyrinogen-III synthase [Acidimicrobiaceae bacterium]|nr:uroporphyrinogen-III synthase [Acidimicrobiaceae bacterium]
MAEQPGQILRGFTVGITADRRADEQAVLFERRGASILHGPAIRTLPLGAEGPLRAATEAIIATPPDVLIANTGLGIRSWLGAADTWDLGAPLLGALRPARIYARGPKASGAAHQAGLAVVARSPTERLRDVVDLVLAEMAPGQRVVLQVDGSGESAEAERLRRAGAEVVVVPVYLWKLPEDPRPTLRLAEAVIAGRVHAVTFTAGPAVRNWLTIAAEAGIDDDLRHVLTSGRVIVGCVGPVCADTARSVGIDSEHMVLPAAWRLGPLVRAVADRLAERAITVPLGGAKLVVTGTVATVAGEAVCLTDTEARLLATLAGRPNSVFTKEHLLRAVWDNETEDPHAVEVGIARLRRRLGVHGRAVASVHRRGYTLRA